MGIREYKYDNKDTGSGFHVEIDGDPEVITEMESFLKGAKSIIDDPFVITEFIRLLKLVKSDNLFNPYTDTCPVNDLVDSSLIRTDNLRKYLEQTRKAKILLIGEAPGHLGCRRTGLAFTDERHIKIANETFGVEFNRATKGGQNKEISALHVWEVLQEIKNIEDQPMVWNIIPFHPEDLKSKNYPLSNRTPNGKDYEACDKVIKYLMKNKKFDEIYAIGKQAQNKLTKMGFKVKYIRHPSMGGSNIFKKQLRIYLGLVSIPKPQKNKTRSMIGYESCIGINEQGESCGNGRRKNKKTCKFHKDQEPVVKSFIEPQKPLSHTPNLDDYF
ncbi:MAG: hypothetical protein HeimC2_33030 [Candidatus Heimdallarchaeota archaeon LC_2]|nr:MAG: hypothetical protein HeimC2_33030 [Candidatus Heimdallarchaeota archaeon LC_2]